ncbi:protein WVD2-like 7 [Capsicum annuum]
MAGDIEEPFRLSFQADSWQSGSISFGRFENEALCWERRSSFTHNKYLEEVEKCSKPGSVTEKKAYFEERFRRRALLSQSSSDCQNGADSQASYDGPENTDYEGDFEHVNEIGHSTRFVENHDRAATLLENGEYQASKNEGYAEHLEHVNEVVHSARFDENHGRSTRLSKNGKYQSENTGYGGDFERVNEVGDSARFEESFDGSNNGDIEVTECGREGSSNGDIEVTKCGREGSSNGDIEGTECGSEDNIISHSGRLTEQYTCSSDVLQSVLKHLEAEAKFNLNAGNAAFNDPKPTIEVKEKLVGQDSSIEFSSNSVDLSSNAHTTEKDGTVSSKPRRSSSSKVRTASQSRDTKSRMLSQVNVASVKGTISNQAYKDMPRKPNRRHSDVSLTQKREKPRLNASGTLLRPTARMPKPEVSSGSKSNVLNQHKSTEQQAISRKVVASRSSCTKKVSHRLYQSVSRDKESVNSFQPGVKQNGSSFHFKSEERAMKRKEFFMKLEEKVHAKEEEMHQLQARTQEKKEAEIKQLRRNLNFKATPMPSFYREPGRRAEKDKESASKTKSSKLQSRPSTAGARATSATDNTVRRSRAEVYNRCSTNERLNVSDSPQVSEATVHPSAELSDSSVPPSAPTSKTSKQTQSNRTVAPKRDQEKRQVTNSPRPRTSDSIRRSKDFKSEDKTKVVARRTGNHALRKDVRSVDLSHSTRIFADIICIDFVHFVTKLGIIIDLQPLFETDYIILEEIICQQFLVVLICLFMAIHGHSLRRRYKNRREIRYCMNVRIPKTISHLNCIINDSDTVCIDKLRMDRNAFHTLVLLTKNVGGLTDGKYMSSSEKLAMFLNILAHHEKNRSIKIDYIRSGWSGCLGALDGTYIHIRVPSEYKPRYRTWKGDIATNVLGVCNRNLNFTYVLPGWEGSAADGRVLQDAIVRHNGLKIPQGNYYLCDGGYRNGKGFLSPYRGYRYWLRDWQGDNPPPRCREELFNMKHARARNVIEGAFSLLKGHWGILRSSSWYSVKVHNRIISACCLIHNFIRREMEVDPLDMNMEEQMEDQQENINVVESSEEWTNWRDELAQSMWNARSN